MNNEWKTKYQELLRVKDELIKYSMTMTPVEQAKLMEKKKLLLQANLRRIIDGSINELLSKAENVRLSRAIYERYKRDEINSWDSAKLQSAYGVMRVLLEMNLAGVGSVIGEKAQDRIKKLFKEVKDSQDKYKLRSFTDLLDGVITKVGDIDEARAINLMKFEANNILNSLRETPDITKFRDGVFTSFEQFSQTLREFRQVSIETEEGDAQDIYSTGAFGDIFHRLDISKDEDGVPVVKVMDTDKRFQ